MIVHISNNFLSSTVHSSLTNAIAKSGVAEQFVYCPLQRKFNENKDISFHESVSVASPRIFNQFIRYLPFAKVLLSLLYFFISLRKHKVKPSFIVAHNLWSDGMVAWLYSIYSGVPFIVAVRNTDINHFIPKLPHFRWLIKKLVKDSERVVFINKAYAHRLRRDFPSIYKKINGHSVIYNGIDDQWFILSRSKEEGEREKQVCFLGSFVKNKNLKNSVLAIQLLRNEGMDIKYVAIGGSEKQFINATGLEEIPGWAKVIPRIIDRSLIRDRFVNSRVFLMPSFKETFGLVYIEALSQGCCIVHSEGEGIDGVFNRPFIRSVKPCMVGDIASKVRQLINDYPSGISKEDVEDLVSNFSWSDIAEQYLKIISEYQIINSHLGE